MASAPKRTQIKAQHRINGARNSIPMKAEMPFCVVYSSMADTETPYPIPSNSSTVGNNGSARAQNPSRNSKVSGTAACQNAERTACCTVWEVRTARCSEKMVSIPLWRFSGASSMALVPRRMPSR